MKAYLSNGREYTGSVYVMGGVFHHEENKGKLMAFCNGYMWDLNCSTCLAPLKDENNKPIMFPDRPGQSGILKDGQIKWE